MATGDQYALPCLGVDEALAFFTHQSLERRQEDIDVFYNDLDGLEGLGTDILPSCIYEIFIRDHMGGIFSVKDMKALADGFLVPENIVSIVDACNLMGKIRCLPSVARELELSETKVKVFYAFVGALWAHRGQQTLFHWIKGLLDRPRSESRKRGSDDLLSDNKEQEEPSHEHHYNVSRKRQRLQDDNIAEIQEGSQSSSGSAIASGAQQLPEDSAISLHRFNELAQQLGKSVNFHCQEVMEVTWHAECFVNEISYGKGIGRSKVAARTEAAQKANRVLGWSD